MKANDGDAAPTNADLARLINGEVGFSGEIRCHQRLLNAGYDVHPSPYYTDDETKKQREIDFATFTQTHFRRGGRFVEAEFYFVADVKTSTTPTIVFLSPKTIWDLGGITTPFFAQRNLNSSPECSAYYNTLVGEIFGGNLIGRSIVKHLSRSERDAKNQFSANFFREAMFSAVKAAIFEWQTERTNPYWVRKGDAVAKFFIPLIVIDGPLKSCVAQDETLDVKDIPYCALRFDAEIEMHQEIYKGKNSSFFVAVCQIDHLVEFMRGFDKILERASFRDWVANILQGGHDWQRFEDKE